MKNLILLLLWNSGDASGVPHRVPVMYTFHPRAIVDFFFTAMDSNLHNVLS